jgi:hypothetical protein
MTLLLATAVIFIICWFLMPPEKTVLVDSRILRSAALLTFKCTSFLQHKCDEKHEFIEHMLA